MSADALPITPARFAAALKDLPLSSLHLKLLELHNSIAHLDYSNEQLRPFAEGTATAQSQSQSQSQSQPQQQQQLLPDQDCIDAIRENEEVIGRMQERTRLVRAEVESRGLRWDEFQSQGEEREAEKRAEEAEAAAGRDEEDEEEEDGAEGMSVGGRSRRRMVNGHGGVVGTADREEEDGELHAAWRDGTFRTGVIRDGVVHMDALAGSAGSGRDQGQSRAGGSLTDEELRRRMEEQLGRLGGDDEDAEGGLHL